MAAGLGEQLERGMSWIFLGPNPWNQKRRSGQYRRTIKSRRERRRAKRDPECQPHYGKYWGYEL